MKSKSLFKSFLNHVDSHPDSIDKSLPNAMLYGTDEFKINYQKKAIKLNGSGWVPCEGVQDSDNPEWLTLFWLQGKIIVDLGKGDPFKLYKSGYTYKEHRYNLVPYCASLS